MVLKQSVLSAAYEYLASKKDTNVGQSFDKQYHRRTKVRGNWGGVIHRMFNEAQPARIAANKEQQYREKLQRE